MVWKNLWTCGLSFCIKTSLRNEAYFKMATLLAKRELHLSTLFTSWGWDDETQCSWATITSRKKVEQNQAYPVIALYMDINWAKFQNPTHSLFWENANWSCVVKSLHGELRFTIFAHFATFHPLNQARAEFDINRTWSLWKTLSFATKKLKIGKLS